MITKSKVRKIYTPLSICTSVEVQGSQAQIYDTMSGVYSPDRSQSALKIVPKAFVATGSSDSTWEDGLVNRNLSEIKWYANGQEISTVSAFAGKYSIDTVSADSNRGTLTITANIAPATQYELVMVAKFADPRTSSSMVVSTDPVSLFTTEKTIDEWDMSVVHDVNIKYHPLFDKLKEYDYKVQKGIISASETEKNKCYDGNQYDLTMPIIITHGKAKISASDKAKCAIKMYVVASDKAKHQITPEDSLFLKELTLDKIRIDQRLIPDGTQMFVCLEVTFQGETKVMSTEQLTITRIVDNYTCEMMNDGDIDITRSKRYDKVICMVGKTRLVYPEAYLQIDWYTNSANKTAVLHGSGETVVIDIEKADLGTGTNCWMEKYVESRVKSYVAAITVEANGKLSMLTNGMDQLIVTDVLEG